MELTKEQEKELGKKIERIVKMFFNLVVPVVLLIWAGVKWHSGEEGFVQAVGEKEIANALRAPASAKIGQVKIVEHKGQEYTVEADVDAQNAFGAYIRSRFCANITVLDFQRLWSSGHYKAFAFQCER